MSRIKYIAVDQKIKCAQSSNLQDWCQTQPKSHLVSSAQDPLMLSLVDLDFIHFGRNGKYSKQLQLLCYTYISTSGVLKKKSILITRYVFLVFGRVCKRVLSLCLRFLSRPAVD